MVGEVADEAEFRRKLEKRGYHVVEVKQQGDFITGWCIYIRNLSPECKSIAKKITAFPKMGDTITWTGRG